MVVIEKMILTSIKEASNGKVIHGDCIILFQTRLANTHGKTTQRYMVKLLKVKYIRTRKIDVKY